MGAQKAGAAHEPAAPTCVPGGQIPGSGGRNPAPGGVSLTHAALAGRERVGLDSWFLHFDVPELASRILPGQFLMVGMRPPATFLKRPFSVADAADGRITLLLRSYGEGTLEMSRRRIGDPFELLGPFGRGFRLDAPAARAVMIAGGIGLAPFYILARRLKELPTPPQVWLVYGERSREAVTAGVERVLHFDRVLTYTEDGSAGERGNAVDGFRRLAAAGELTGARLYACGPHRMLEALEVERERLGTPAEYSMEERMGCGFGICQGCAVPANPAHSAQAYHLLCKAGPVMDPTRVLWSHPALP